MPVRRDVQPGNPLKARPRFNPLGDVNNRSCGIQLTRVADVNRSPRDFVMRNIGKVNSASPWLFRMQNANARNCAEGSDPIIIANSCRK